jgi:RecQ-mediated genome instability protein 1
MATMPPPAPNGLNKPAIPPAAITQITTALMERYSLPISPGYLTTFLTTTRHPFPPIPALISTLHFRLLASDITQSLSSVCPLPSTITDPKTKEQKLTWNTPVQVLDIADIGSSKYSQLETLEMIERGEMIKGREIIRTVNVEETAEGTANTTSTKRSNGPFKLLLQDAKGMKVHAFTVSPISKIGMPMSGDEGIGAMCIGCKLVLRKGTVARRGVLMIKPNDVNVFGGKVEGWDKEWRELDGRKKRLEGGMVTM